jgi:methionine synthase II (cobalamin-independent)
VAERVTRLWNRLGFPAARLAEQVVVTPACGLAGCPPDQSRALLRRAVETGRALAERSAG